MSNFLAGTVPIKTTELKDLPMSIQIWSYLMVFLPMLCIPGYAIYKLIITPGKNFDEVKDFYLNKLIKICDSFIYFKRLQRAVQPEEPAIDFSQSESTAEQEKQQQLSLPSPPENKAELL